MRLHSTAVDPEGGDVGGLVTDDFAQEIDVLGAEESRVNPDPPGRGVAPAERSPEPWARCYPDVLSQIARVPGDGPFSEPGIDVGVFHERTILLFLAIARTSSPRPDPAA